MATGLDFGFPLNCWVLITSAEVAASRARGHSDIAPGCAAWGADYASKVVA